MVEKPDSEEKQDAPGKKNTFFYTSDGKKFDITPEGSIGLLALGAVGLKAWRKVRKEFYKNNPDKFNNQPDVERAENGEK